MKPKTIFGLIMLATGLIVVAVTFLGNHGVQPTMAGIKCATTEERLKYIASCGYETDKEESSKQVRIPQQFNDVYNCYNDIQKQQGFDLEKYKGKTVTLYTYSVINYKDNKNVIADLIIYEGKLIGADLCDPSADSGFLVALNEQN